MIIPRTGKIVLCRTPQVVGSCGGKICLFLTSSLDCLLQPWCLWGRVKAHWPGFSSLQKAESKGIWGFMPVRILLSRNYDSHNFLPHSDLQSTKCQWKQWYCDIRLRLWFLLFFMRHRQTLEKKPHHRALLCVYGLETHFSGDMALNL